MTHFSDELLASLLEELQAIEQGFHKGFDASTCCGFIMDIREARARVAKLEEALEGIVQWSKAYPLNIFPEPDLKRVRSLLEAGGVTLDAVSACAMRHVIKGVGEIARAALAAEPASGDKP